MLETILRVYDDHERLFQTKAHQLVASIDIEPKLKRWSVRIRAEEEDAKVVVLTGYESKRFNGVGYTYEEYPLSKARHGSCGFGGFYAFSKIGLARLQEKFAVE